MFINRSYNRTEHDDFVLNVQPRMSQYDSALGIHDEEGNLVGWLIRLWCE